MAAGRDGLKDFLKAVQSMMLYRRAEQDLVDDDGELIVHKIYVDPLPRNHVLETMLRSSTTFLIGRKGTGKSTVFQRAQYELKNSKDVATTYVDIKTIYESANAGVGPYTRRRHHRRCPPG